MLPMSLFPYPFPVGVRWFPSAAGLDRYLHARQDPHSQDISHSDLQSSFVAESARECRHGSLSGEGGVTYKLEYLTSPKLIPSL